MPHYMTRFFLTCFCIAWVPWFGQTAEPPTTTSEREDAIFWDSVFSHNHVLDIQITLTHETWDAMQPRRKEGQTGEKVRRLTLVTSLTTSKPMLSSITNRLRVSAYASRAIRLTVSLPMV